MTNNKQRREIQERLAARRAEKEFVRPPQQTRIMLLLNGLNPMTGTPFTDEQMTEMKEQIKTPYDVHVYYRILAGRAGLGSTYDRRANPYFGMTAEDFHRLMDDFYIKLGWTS